MSKADELFDLALSLAMYVFIIVIIASIEYYGNWISEQLAMVIIVGGALGFAGATALIYELASTRRLRAIYALLATLYVILAGTVLTYYRENLYSVFGIVGVFVAVFIATELLGRLPNY